MPAPANTTPSPNRDWFAQILDAQRRGQTCLPFELGLYPQDFVAFIAQHFPERRSEQPDPERDELRADLLEMRRDEWQQLYELLLNHRHTESPDEAHMAAIIAAACMGANHLWCDLGLVSRQQLRDILSFNFPTLTERNTRNMRWKRFFYKQLCEQEGSYVCRSPTCEQCHTYQECFGDEH